MRFRHWFEGFRQLLDAGFASASDFLLPTNLRPSDKEIAPRRRDTSLRELPGEFCSLVFRRNNPARRWELLESRVYSENEYCPDGDKSLEDIGENGGVSVQRYIEPFIQGETQCIPDR